MNKSQQLIKKQVEQYNSIIAESNKRITELRKKCNHPIDKIETELMCNTDGWTVCGICGKTDV